MTITLALLLPPAAFAPRAQAAEDVASSPTEPSSEPRSEPPSEPRSEPRAASSGPTQPDARLRYDQGLTLFAQKQYAAAIVAFDLGYAKEPHRAFLFAKAQAQRLAGDCARAIVTYDAFLATAPPPQQADATHLAIERCARAAALTPGKPSPALTLAAPVPAWRRPPALALWTAAGLALGASTWLYFSFRGARDDAARIQERRDPQAYDLYAAAWRRGNARLHESELALLAGLLFTAGGAVYAWRAGPSSPAEDGPVALWLAPHAGGFGFHAQF